MHRRALVALAILALTWTACGGGGESKPAAQTPSATSQPAMTATPNAPVLTMTLEQAGVAKRTNAPDPSMFGTSFAAADTPEAYFRVASRDTGVRTAWVETILTVKGIPLSRNVTRAKAGAWSSAQLRLPVTGD